MRHGSEEGRIHSERERVCAWACDPAARYQRCEIDLILDDEHRQHLGRRAQAASWTTSTGSILDDEHRQRSVLVEMATAMAWSAIAAAESPLLPLGWHLDEEPATAVRTLRARGERGEMDCIGLLDTARSSMRIWSVVPMRIRFRLTGIAWEHVVWRRRRGDLHQSCGGQDGRSRDEPAAPGSRVTRRGVRS